MFDVFKNILKEGFKKKEKKTQNICWMLSKERREELDKLTDFLDDFTDNDED